MIDGEEIPEYWTHYFVGVPAPAAAALGLFPVLMCFDFPVLEVVLRSNAFCAVLMCLVTFLMVSRIPTVSVKKTKVKTSMFVPLMLVVVLLVNFMLTQPWLTLGIATCIYMLSIPLSCMKFLKDKKRYEAKKTA
jgi:CDP-diacylglycerol--serine O-phosphatidyltransferase